MSPPGKNTEQQTRVVVLEEHPLLRQGIVDFLRSQPDLLVCGEADNIRAARDQIAKCKPHLLLTALRLGAGDSLEFVKELKARQPALLILVYSAFEETIFAERALRSGAEGYVMKKAPKEELLAALREIVNGNIYVSRDVALRAFKKLLESPGGLRSPGPISGIERLSDREIHVFQLVGTGLRNRQIAESLSLSVKTIESHRENIKHKLGLSSNRELVERAIKYVEEAFQPDAKAAGVRGKKKVVRFPGT